MTFAREMFFVCLFVCAFVRSFVCLFVRAFVCVLVCLFVRSFVCVFVFCLFICTYGCEGFLWPRSVEGFPSSWLGEGFLCPWSVEGFPGSWLGEGFPDHGRLRGFLAQGRVGGFIPPKRAPLHQKLQLHSRRRPQWPPARQRRQTKTAPKRLNLESLAS